MPYALKFTLQGLPKATNALLGGHWRNKSSNAGYWKRQVALAVAGRRPEKPLEGASLTLVRRNYRTLDYDGLVASFKPIVDGLVEVGVLKNDTWKITGAWDVSQEYCKKEEAHIEVIVCETEDMCGAV